MTTTLHQLSELIQNKPCNLADIMKTFELNWMEALDLTSSLMEFDKIGFDKGYYYWR